MRAHFQTAFPQRHSKCCTHVIQKVMKVPPNGKKKKKRESLWKRMKLSLLSTPGRAPHEEEDVLWLLVFRKIATIVRMWMVKVWMGFAALGRRWKAESLFIKMKQWVMSARWRKYARELWMQQNSQHLFILTFLFGWKHQSFPPLGFSVGFSDDDCNHLTSPPPPCTKEKLQ